MQLLPSGFELPPLPYLLIILTGVTIVGGLLYRNEPRITPHVVAGFAPWMVAGATAYALYQVDALPSVISPLLGNPLVYATMFVIAGAVWLACADQPADRWKLPSVPGILMTSGGSVAIAFLAAAMGVALNRGTLALVWPTVGLVLATLLAGVTWVAIRDRLAVAETGAPGILVLFGHVLDGVSTAIGSHLGFGEQTPLSALIIEFGGRLPLATYLGEAWLFVVVKLLLAVVVLRLLADYIHEEPGEGALLLGAIAAVGLGPGVHNLVLFALT